MLMTKIKTTIFI